MILDSFKIPLAVQIINRRKQLRNITVLFAETKKEVFDKNHGTRCHGVCKRLCADFYKAVTNPVWKWKVP